MLPSPSRAPFFPDGCPHGPLLFVVRTTTILRRSEMSRVIVIQFITLDGIVEDPNGAGGTKRGGWAFRYGPESVAGDKFKLGGVMETGALLVGRATWQL